MNKETLEKLKARTARAAVGASTAHKMGPKGTIAAAREFLQGVNLRKFGNAKTERAYFRLLDAETTALQNALPRTAQHWGSARKFLNIFLRNCAYNKYLCSEYALDTIEQWMEVPLDSHVASGLREQPEGAELVRWRTVIGLTPEESAILQEVASRIANREGIARVHLDVHYWNGPHVKPRA
ncbi:hypothetical protein [Achromobacter xylosoxidans]|uniref:Uncharacterized protein n=1 Tax=Alcaligenes xylosoxydans xylosoxydans TaxID=85698 RepID=A0A1R1JNT4_ALCXX|nr:hypothetical protein [Achromobacter xylosoxidans]OMG79978.1 hypothetical protein BIZ92_32010 [Achromobacter xylosoxidans]BEG74221.1 hypothetical protein HBIAX_01268 [Achromobacter xylosoxidans]